jgi:[ribosomal protein S18]-alanine N-acetyltransferase
MHSVLRFEPLADAHMDAVVALEQSAYAHAWAQNHFADALVAGYQAQVLMAHDEVLGYFIAMQGVDEVHLLNITVAPKHQGNGLATIMLEALAVWTRGLGLQWVWLEVRVGNVRAISLYERQGFVRVGMRKNYYPAHHGQRESAVVMSWNVASQCATQTLSEGN